jgi:hypothetical protein
MAILKINGDTSGSVSLTVPDVAGTNTVTVPAQTGTLEMLGSGTAVTASGTSVDFTSIPSWVKRITIMLNGLSTNGASVPLVQVGSGSVTTSGYTGASSVLVAGVTSTNYTTGVALGFGAAASIIQGGVTLLLIGSNTWTAFGVVSRSDIAATATTGSNVTLSGALDRVRITTVNGTDTFDAGSINILYEG